MSRRAPLPRAAGAAAKKAIEVINLASSDEEDDELVAAPPPRPQPRQRAGSAASACKWGAAAGAGRAAPAPAGQKHKPTSEKPKGKGRLKRTAEADSPEWQPETKEEEQLEDSDVEEIEVDEEDEAMHLAKRPRVISSQGQAPSGSGRLSGATATATAVPEAGKAGAVRQGGSQPLILPRPASQDTSLSPTPSQPLMSQSQLLRHLLQGGGPKPAAAGSKPAAARAQQGAGAAAGSGAGAAAQAQGSARQSSVRAGLTSPVPATNKTLGSGSRAGIPAASAGAGAGAGAGLKSGGGAEGSETTLWVDKHMPASEAELAVARKKVQEVRDWLDYQLPHNRRPSSIGRMLVISGPPGSGKSTTVKILAKAMGYNVVEWTPRAPVLWHELQYQGSSRDPLAPSYTSKLNEFEMFVSRAKYLGAPPAPKRGGGFAGSLAKSQPEPGGSQLGGSGAPAPGSSGTIILLDDLPHVHDLERRDRLSSALCLLAATARGPVVVITTEATGTSGSAAGAQEGGANLATGSYRGLHKDVLEALQDTGAGMLTFNALTAPSISKVLLKVAETEGRQLSEAAATSIASLSQGDLRAAVQTLQLMFGSSRGEHVDVAAAVKAAKKRGARKAPAAVARATGSRAGGGACGGGREIQPHEAKRLASAQRDQGLDLFHALGKFLYNKRNTDAAEGAGVNSDEEGEGGAGDGSHFSSRQGTAGGGGSSGSVGAGGGGKRGPGPKALATAAAMAAIKDAARVHDTSGRHSWMPSFADTELRLPDSLRRPPMRYDPEAILVKAGLEPLAVASFLHENYLNFVDEQAMGDVEAAAAYLSSAAFLACYRPTTSGYQGFWGEEETTASDLQGACAASVATRGIMFANAHPAPRRWLPLQGPVHGAVERARVANTAALAGVSRKLAVLQGTSTGGGCGAAIASQALPWVRQLASSPGYGHLGCVLPENWSYFWQGKVTQQQAGGATNVDSRLLEQMGGMGLGRDGDEGTEQDDPVEEV